jgi:hypothetical protein
MPCPSGFQVRFRGKLAERERRAGLNEMDQKNKEKVRKMLQ